jgi:hypothetical protein
MSGYRKHLSCLKRDPERFASKMITERDEELKVKSLQINRIVRLMLSTVYVIAS